MENGLTFLFKSEDLKNLLKENSTHVHIVAKLVMGEVDKKNVAVMVVHADAYLETTSIPPLPSRMQRVNKDPVAGCPIPPCKDPDKELTDECVKETEALLNSYKNNNFTTGFNF